MSEWENVTFSVVGTGAEKGVLKAGKRGQKTSYRFDPYSSRGNAKYYFQQKHMENRTCEGATVKFTVTGITVAGINCALIFANEEDAAEFFRWEQN